MDSNIPKMPESLRRRVLTSIRQEERRRAQVYLLASAGIAAVSGGGIFVSVRHLAQELSQSSFWSYMSLLTSDTDIVLANSAVFLSSLAETLPLIGIIAFFSATLLLLGAVRVFAINVRVGFIPSFNNT